MLKVIGLKIAKFLGLLRIEYKIPTKNPTVKGEVSRISKDIIVALCMALIFIQFIIQAFKIPTGSMENSLLVGDFLLGLKFVYGSPIPFTYNKLPGIREPKKNDVVIFKYSGDPNYPNNDEERYTKLLNTFIFGILFWDKTESRVVVHSPKDFIKRCVGAPGDTLLVKNKELFVNNKPFKLAKDGRFGDINIYPYEYDTRDNFGPYIVPKKGETFKLKELSLRKLFWIRSLIYQENPNEKLISKLKFIVNDTVLNEITQKGALYMRGTYWDWYGLEQQIKQQRTVRPDADIKLECDVYLNGELLTEYTLKYSAFFMMGDNRDESLDSRYWGFVSKRFVNAKAFILYFSWEGSEPFYNAIRFSRIGKLIF